MGKRRCFLGFLVSLCVFVFSANSFAADGYTCEKEYISCSKTNYYLDNGQCRECPSGEGWESTAQEATATFCTCPENYRNSESETGDTTVTAGQTCVLAKISIYINKNGGTGMLTINSVSGDAPENVTEIGGAGTETLNCTPGAVFRLSGISRAGYTLNGFSGNQYATSGDTTITCPSSSTTLYAIWGTCEAGSYCDGNGEPKKCSEEIGDGWTSAAGSDEKEDCYYNITLNKNGFSGTLRAGSVDDQLCAIEETATGTDNATLQLHWNSECTLPIINFTREGWENATAWSNDSYGYATVVTKIDATTETPETDTYYAVSSGCQNGYVNREGACESCEEPYSYSDQENNQCYRDCEIDAENPENSDVPYATEYNDGSKFYEGEEQPSQCSPLGCLDGYYIGEDEMCHPATYIVRYSCGEGTGSIQNDEATYKASFTANDGNGCTMENHSFAGWAVSQTDDVKSAGETFTWEYTEDKTFTAKYQLTSCAPGEYLENGVCVDCPAGSYCDGSGEEKPCSTEIASGWFSKAKSSKKQDCYYDITLHKNGFSGTLDAGPIDGQLCEIAQTKEGTENATLQLHWNSACTLPTINFTKEGWNNADKWSTSLYGYDTVTTIAAITTNTVPDTTTYYAFGDGCDDGYVAMGDSGECTACPEDFPYSDHAENACYRDCTEGDIPNATSYTEDSKFYENEEAPSHCVAESCESGYEGEDCHDASGITYKVCHYTKNVGTSTYTLHDNECENKTGTSNATITLANLKKTITGFTYDAGFAGTSTHGTTKPSSGAVTTTTVLPDGSRVVDLYYNRNTYTLTLTKGTGIDAVTGAGTKEYGESVTINATVTTNYTWSNWTNNNSNNAEVSATKNYPFTMPANDLSYRANAVLGSRNCVAGYKDEQGQQPCDDGYYCPGGTVAASQSCQQPCPERPQGAKDLTTTGDRTAITQCQVTLTCVDAFNSNHELTGGGDKVCKYVDADRGYDNCIDVVVKYCLAGYYHDAVDTPFCTEVPVGSWSPDRAVANSCDNDPASKGMYSCDVLVNGVSATTAGKASGSPTACYTSCPTVPVTDGTDAAIGTLRPDTETKNFSGTVTYSSTEPVTVVSVNGSYPACTYNNNEADCLNGYHANGTSCDPNIYKFILDKNGGTGGTDGPIYMKYNDGWYSNASATAASRITSITLPNKDEQNCSGYDMGATTVINADGTITALPTIVNYADATTTTTLVAGWGDKQKTHCDPGYYYSAETDSCEECLPGSYCPGGDAFSGEDNDGDDLIFDCPTPAASNYTPAQSWSATTGLSNVLPQMSSDRGRTSISDCFATVRYDAIQGAGSQKCYYDATNETYDSSDCVANSITILTCNGGHHYNASETTIDCVPVGKGYYSIEYDPSRTRCPQAETYGDNITTNGTTSDSVGLCIHDNFWESKQNDANVNGAYIKRCFWNSDDSEYNINCGQSYRMRKCKAGYYDPHEGEATYAADARCIAVEDGNWSPGPANWNAVTEPDASIQINACPETSAYAGTVANDIDSTKTNPATGTETASSKSECYLTCKAEKNIGGITYTNTDNNHHTLYSDGEYPACRYNSTGLLCSVATNGAFDLPTSEVADINQCYRNCTTADIDGATGVSGTVTYTGTRTCTATSCDDEHCIAAGSNGNICIPKPDNGTCTNNPEHPITCNEGYHLNDDETDCVPNEITLRFANGGHGTAPTSPNKCTYGQRFTMPAAMTAVDGYEFDKWSASNNNFEARASVVCNKANLGVASGTATITAEWKPCQTGYYCDGNGDDNGKHKCPTEWPYSEPGATQSSQCYRNCDGGTASDGCIYTPIPGHEKAYYDAVCQYNATLDGDPAEYNPNTDSCTKTGCPQGEQLVNGECEPCDYPDNVLSYVPNQGCKVESCTIGYHPVNDHCEPDVEDCTPADQEEVEYAEHKWVATRGGGAWGICEIKSCKEGFHLIANSCVANVQTCEIEHANEAKKEWNPRTKQFGPCIATSCVAGYTNDPYEKNDASKQCSECRNMYSTLGEVAASSYSTGCVIASCYHANEKYYLDKGLNECVPICNPERSDETGDIEWNESRGVCERKCHLGYTSWP